MNQFNKFAEAYFKIGSLVLLVGALLFLFVTHPLWLIYIVSSIAAFVWLWGLVVSLRPNGLGLFKTIKYKIQIATNGCMDSKRILRGRNTSYSCSIENCKYENLARQIKAS